MALHSQGQGRPKDKAGLKAFLRSHMHRLQKTPDKVRAFFQAPEVRYAA